MITGEIKNRIDSIWDTFWTGGITNSITILEQMTYLFFMKMLDDAQRTREANAHVMGVAVKDPTFKEGMWHNPDTDRDVPYADLRWSVFKNMEAEAMYRLVSKDVFIFIKTLNGGKESAYSKFMASATFLIQSPRTLVKIVEGIDSLDMNNRDTMGDVYEYVLGKMAASGNNGQFRTPRHIINMMVGRVIYEEPKTHSSVAPDAEIVLEAEHLVSPDVKDVSFCLHRGEILGFAGLMGAGRTETMRLVCGADPKDSGVIKVKGKPVKIHNPKDAVKVGIGYLSEDRKRFGLCLGLSVADNTVLPSLDDFSGPLLMHDKKVNDVTNEYIEKIHTKTPSTKALVRGLSGGNQQKVIVSKWLLRDCDVLIFDEPTRGIDVGAKSEIYKLMNQLASEGKSIIMISSEMPELLRMSDRVVVMCEGRVTGELDISEATQEKVMTLATKRE